MNPSSADLVLMLNLVSAGDQMARGGFMENIGGVRVMCIVADPFEHRLPAGLIWSENWRISFDLPKGYPTHLVLNANRTRFVMASPNSRQSMTVVQNIEFTGDREAFEQALIFAKMLA
jgi:hypothetical protein